MSEDIFLNLTLEAYTIFYYFIILFYLWSSKFVQLIKVLAVKLDNLFKPWDSHRRMGELTPAHFGPHTE